MHVGARKMERYDRPPLHVDCGMQFHVLFRLEVTPSFLPGEIELSDAEPSSIDGNILPFFLKAIESFPFSSLR